MCYDYVHLVNLSDISSYAYRTVVKPQRTTIVNVTLTFFYHVVYISLSF